MFWVMLLVFVATTVISALLRPHNTIHPSALGDFTLPTASTGRAIPVVFGTTKISGGNTVWWGDLKSKAIKQGGFLSFLSGGAQTVGYKYYLGVQYVLCQGPIDDLVAMESDSKSLPYTRSGSDPLTTYVNASNIFGGTPTGQGGLAGNIFLYFGTTTQNGDPYLSQKQNETSLQANPGSLPVFVGVGNGGLNFVAPGTSSVPETITITATSTFYTNDKTKPYYKARQFIVTGSVSGRIFDSSGNSYAFQGFAFGSSKINFTISGGAIDFVAGDYWTITMLGARVSPNYRGICYAVLKNFYVGVSSSPRPIAFVVRRCPDPLAQGASIANISGDANPALVIYDLLTNVRYGLGIVPGQIDATSFSNAATTLANEALGVSMLFDSHDTADTLISEVLRHADGVLYVEPQTGLWTLKLARADYNVATIPALDVNSVEECQLARASWGETSNQVTVTYVDRSQDFNLRTVKQEDNGNIAITGEVRAEMVDFKGLSNAAAAALICTRALKGASFPLSKVTIKVNRAAWSYRIGGVFKLTWVPLGIVNQVYRIIKIGYGEVANGKIMIDAVEDIFGINNTLYDAPPISGWINPVGTPTAPIFDQLAEIPLELAPSSAIYAMAMVARSQGNASSFEVWQPVGGSDTKTNEVTGFAPLGILQGPYLAATPAFDTVGLTLGAGGADLSALPTDATSGTLYQPKNLLMIDSEIISWENWTLNTDGTVTISNILRGVMDTVPQDHAAGSIVWFFSEGSGLTQPNAYPADLTVQAKILPKNTAGTYPLASASYITVTTKSRYARPYPPGDLVYSGVAYGTRYTFYLGSSAPVVLVWKSRNRLTQAAAAVLIKQDNGDITPEAGTTYKVLVVIGGSTVRTVSAITVESFSYSVADRLSDGGAGAVTLQIFSNANTLDSFMPQQITFELTGFGIDFGNAFGGLTL